MSSLDILIPVYHEGRSILGTLEHLSKSVKAPFQILICYDEDEDPTLDYIRSASSGSLKITLIKNRGVGVHAAIMTGFKSSLADSLIVYPADDCENGYIVDEMRLRAEKGVDIVAPSRFMKGGCMVGCRPSKAVLVRTAAFLLHFFAGIPTHDPTNGFRLFSRRVLNEIPVESSQGFTYSIELLVKAHRRGWRVEEVPSKWFERKKGKSRFKIMKWMPAYLRWFFYAFMTRFLRRRE